MTDKDLMKSLNRSHQLQMKIIALLQEEKEITIPEILGALAATLGTAIDTHASLVTSIDRTEEFRRLVTIAAGFAQVNIIHSEILTLDKPIADGSDTIH